MGKKSGFKSYSRVDDGILDKVSGGVLYDDFDEDTFDTDMVCPFCQKLFKSSEFDPHVNQCPKKPKDL